MPSSTHWFLAASRETGATGGLAAAAVLAGGAVAFGALAGEVADEVDDEVDDEVAVLLATAPVGVSVNVSVVVVPAGVTLVFVTPGGEPEGVAVVCVVACPSV